MDQKAQGGRTTTVRVDIQTAEGRTGQSWKTADGAATLDHILQTQNLFHRTEILRDNETILEETA